jgi:tryptophan synthase alpha chain
MELANPLMVGFGISDGASFRAAAAHARGGIIGSAFLRVLMRGGDLRRSVQDFVRSVREGA